MRFLLKEGSELSSESKAVAREICEGARGEVPAPLRAWLINPRFASMSQNLGQYLRFNSSLPRKLSELSILCVAKFWGSPFEWEVHKKDALKAGLSLDTIDAIDLGSMSTFESEIERLIYKFCTDTLEKKHVDDDTYQSLHSEIGEQGILDLIGIMGYYTLISLTLNVLKIDQDVPPLRHSDLDSTPS